MSYHTDFVQYSRTYGGFPGAAWMAYRVLNVFHNRAGVLRLNFIGLHNTQHTPNNIRHTSSSNNTPSMLLLQI